MTGRILITGADGYLGRRAAGRFLADTDEQLVLSVRAADRAELTAKSGRLLAELGAAAAARTEVIPADLTQDNPLAALRGKVTCVLHAAARTAFDVPRADAQRINVDGTRRVAEFAATCPGLERFVLLSSLVSAGRRTGQVTEAPLADDAGYANHYEWSKDAAERLLATDFPDLPVSVARLATVISDDDSGMVTQYNAFHNTMKLFFYGLITLVPGQPGTPLYLATAEFTSRGIVHLAQPGAPAGTYHLSPSPAQAVSLREVVDTAFDAFETDPAFRRRRLLRPEFCDLGTFRFLVSASESLRSSPAATALRSVAPFAEQLFSPKQFDNSRLLQAWPDCPVPAGLELVGAVCQTLVRTRWGRKPA